MIFLKGPSKVKSINFEINIVDLQDKLLKGQSLRFRLKADFQ